MFERITRDEAIDLGFTHEGYTYGIPVWLTLNGEFMVATKFEILDPVLTVFEWIDQRLHALFHPDEPFHFSMVIKSAIQ
jgi:hypothetical protein